MNVALESKIHIPDDLSHGLILSFNDLRGNGELTSDLIDEVIDIMNFKWKGFLLNKHWPAHAYLTWVQNFHKGYIAAQEWYKISRKPTDITILDLGCLDGAYSAGICSALSGKVKSINIHGVDQNKRIIDFYNQIFVSWADFSSNIKATSENGSIDGYFVSNLKLWDIVVINLMSNANKTLAKNALTNSNKIIIDIPENGMHDIWINDHPYEVRYDKSASLELRFMQSLNFDQKPNDKQPLLVRR